MNSRNLPPTTIGVSESWLKPSILSSEVSLSGYTLLRNDRLNKVGGGVAAYIREELKPIIIYTSPSEYSAKPEFLFIEVSLFASGCLLLGVCYRSPKVGHLADFENALLRIMPGYSRVLLMGDFNTDLIKDKQRYDYRLLTTMFETCNLTILPLEPTHHTAETDTLIDLMVVSDPQDIVHHGQLPIPSVFKHDLIYCVFSVKIPKVSSKFIKYRDFRNLNEVAFMTDVLNSPWHGIEALQNVNDMVDGFNRIILSLYDKYN